MGELYYSARRTDSKLRGFTVRVKDNIEISNKERPVVDKVSQYSIAPLYPGTHDLPLEKKSNSARMSWGRGCILV